MSWVDFDGNPKEPHGNVRPVGDEWPEPIDYYVDEDGCMLLDELEWKASEGISGQGSQDVDDGSGHPEASRGG